MDEYKTCSKCRKEKFKFQDFYFYKGKMRSECKMCTIKRNVAYQKKMKSWRHRYIDNDEKRSYRIDYYAKNKEKFAEYRRLFKLRNPDYYRDYAKKMKEK